MTLRLGVLGSTRGSNMVPILAAIHAGTLDAEIAVVISNHSSAGILQRAQQHNLPHQVIRGKGREREDFDRDVDQVLHAHNVDLVLMIGYMRIVSPWFCTAWQGQLLNIHPSLLPRHAGLMDLDVHRAVLEAGDRESGCTIHQVTAEVDAGAPLLQKRCVVTGDDTPETLKLRVQALEGEAWVEALQAFA